jgi:hypothetical protein
MIRCLKDFRLASLRACLVVLFTFAFTQEGYADDRAPTLRRPVLRDAAQSILASLIDALIDEEQRRFSGIYVAFEHDHAEPRAQIACDDDGDYVIVVTDSMLLLIDELAHAEVLGQNTQVEHFAGALARSQQPGRRMLPLPKSSFRPEGPQVLRAHRIDALRDEILTFVLALEVERLRRGELVCQAPTATRESGDAQWTPEEAAHAAALPRDSRPEAQEARDACALELVTSLGRSVAGAHTFIIWLARLEHGGSPYSQLALHANTRRAALDRRIVTLTQSTSSKGNRAEERPSPRREAWPTRPHVPSFALPPR